MNGHQSEFATELRTPQTGIPCSALLISKQRESTAVLQLLFDQLFTWPADQPRHATLIDDDPVKSDRPRFAGVRGISPAYNNFVILRGIFHRIEGPPHNIAETFRASKSGEHCPAGNVCES